MTDAERMRLAVELLIADLLDEAVPLGEMCRLVDSVRQTIEESEQGIVDDAPRTLVGEHAEAAARALVARLLERWSPALPRRAPDDRDADRVRELEVELEGARTAANTNYLLLRDRDAVVARLEARVRELEALKK